jgi:5-methylcytosine-specific restriction enzyme A
MTSLADLKPKTKPRLMDLVKEAGVNVREWEKSAPGAANPKFCYEWAFTEPGKVVVLTVWHDGMKKRGGKIWCRSSPPSSVQSVHTRRWQSLLKAVRESYSKKIPIRVVISIGTRNPEYGTAQVHYRSLDPVLWWVTQFHENRGTYTLVRGNYGQVVDQFDVQEGDVSAKKAERRTAVVQSFVRDPEVRRRVMERSEGECEWCNRPGFLMMTGQIYLETHHIRPLAEGGKDHEDNVVALCPNHHREAHHGRNQEKMRRQLLGVPVKRKTLSV